MFCEICKKEFDSLRAITVHLKKSHKNEITHLQYYIKYMNGSIEYCPICKKEKPFKGLSKTYQETCGNKYCKNKLGSMSREVSNLKVYGVKNPMQSEKVKETLKANNFLRTGYEWQLSNPKVIEKRIDTLKKEGIVNVFQRESVKKEIRETRKEKTGHDVSSPTKIPEIRQKQIDTTFERYGYESVLELKETREAGQKVQEEKYGAPFFLQSKKFDDNRPIYLEKQYETNRKKYGGITPMSDPDIVEKNQETRRKNNTGTMSKQENEIYEKLILKNLKVYRQYKDSRYPFLCDFYLPDYDLFIEYNGSWTHKGEYFNPKNPNHIDELKKLQMKSDYKVSIGKERNYYKNAIYTWTDLDVRKKKKIEQNKLNFITLWDMDDVDRFLGDDLNLSFTKDSCEDELNSIYKTSPSYEKGSFWNKIILTYQNHFYEKEKELWKNNILVRSKLLNNRCKYLNKKIKDITDYELLRGFKISGIHYGYSFHSPFYIKKFIEDHKDVISIYDPCGGWGHRLLGSMDFAYIYNDIDVRNSEGIRKIVEDFGICRKIIYNQDASKFTPKEHYDAVFTCPPYFNLEKYNNSGSSNISTKLDFLNWWRSVVECSLENCNKYFCFIIDQNNKEDMKNICLEFDLELLDENLLFKKESHFTKGKKLNSEYLLIFKRSLYAKKES